MSNNDYCSCKEFAKQNALIQKLIEKNHPDIYDTNKSVLEMVTEMSENINTNMYQKRVIDMADEGKDYVFSMCAKDYLPNEDNKSELASVIVNSHEPTDSKKMEPIFRIFINRIWDYYYDKSRFDFQYACEKLQENIDRFIKNEEEEIHENYRKN